MKHGSMDCLRGSANEFGRAHAVLEAAAREPPPTVGREHLIPAEGVRLRWPPHAAEINARAPGDIMTVTRMTTSV